MTVHKFLIIWNLLTSKFGIEHHSSIAGSQIIRAAVIIKSIGVYPLQEKGGIVQHFIYILFFKHVMFFSLFQQKSYFGRTIQNTIIALYSYHTLMSRR